MEKLWFYQDLIIDLCLSMINRFIIGLWVVIYFIMQSFLDNVFFLARKSSVRHLIYVISSHSNYYTNKTLWNLSNVDTFVVKLNFTHVSVCLCNAICKWRQVKSWKLMFTDVVGALDHVVLNQIENTVFIWSVLQINIFIQPLFMRHFFLCHCIINVSTCIYILNCLLNLST